MIILADDSGEKNLKNLINQFIDSSPVKIEYYNVNEIGLSDGCRGCTNFCGKDYSCYYDDIDGFSDFYKNTIMTADIIIFAGSVKDRFLSSKWKMYFDRSMFRGHAPTLKGKQIAFLISGPLGQVFNIRDFIEVFKEMQMANLVDIVTDEVRNSKLLS